MLARLCEALVPGGLLGDVFRAACAAGSALVLASVLLPWLERLARARQFADREDKSDSDTLNALHAGKRRTPIVGGIGILAAAGVSALLFARWDAAETWVLLVTLFGLGSLGFADDVAKTFGAKRTQGLTPRQKLAGQLVLGAAVGGFLLVRAHLGASWGWGGPAAGELTTLAVPFTGWQVALGGAGFVLLTAFLLTGSSNAVNLTDGLDGLAGGCALVAFGVYAAIAAAAAAPAAAAGFGIAHAPGGAEVAVVLGALVGGLVAFLRLNRHPARIFMGDTGSLPLGGVLAVAAVLTRQELLLALVGGVFVAEALSVMAQVGSFKLTGKRVLRCAPLHHHFEFKGWRETEVVTRFHTAALVLGLLALAGLGK